MTTAALTFFSPALNQHVGYNVILPDRGDGPFPVLVQLHGLTDDHHAWIQRSNLVRYVERLPLIVVLPNGGTSGYFNWISGDRVFQNRFEDLVVEDIPAHLRRHFHVSGGPWAIGGLSMGGYGAMRIGLKHPDRFASIWSHSSAFCIDHLADPAMVDDPQDAGVFWHAEQLVASGRERPVISFDCGVDDELIQDNRDLHAHMDRIGLAHTYAEYPGAHTWEYWDLHVREALEQHGRVLGFTTVED